MHLIDAPHMRRSTRRPQGCDSNGTCRHLQRIGAAAHALNLPDIGSRSSGDRRLEQVLDGGCSDLDMAPGGSDSHHMRAIASWLLRLIRIALLVVLFFFLLSTVVAFGGPGTGPWEKGVLAVVFLGLVGLAASVHRIGQGRSVIR